MKNSAMLSALLVTLALFSGGCKGNGRSEEKSQTASLDSKQEMNAAVAAHPARKAVTLSTLQDITFQMIGATHSPDLSTFSNHDALFTMTFGKVKNAEGSNIDANGKVSFFTTCQVLAADVAFALDKPLDKKPHKLAIRLEENKKSNPDCKTTADNSAGEFLTWTEATEAAPAQISASGNYLYIEKENGAVWFFRKR